MKRVLISLLLGLTIASAGGGRQGGAADTSLLQSAFCRRNGCVLIETHQRYGRDYQLYQLRIPTSPNVELELYRLNGKIVGAAYSTLMVDDWSRDYAQAAAFMRTVFPGAKITEQFVRRLDTSTDQAAMNAPWNGRPLFLERGVVRVPSIPSLVRVQLNAGTIVVGR